MQSSYPDDIQGACFDVTDDEGDAVLWRYWRISLYMARVVVLEDVEGEPTLDQQRAVRRTATSIFLNITSLLSPASA